MDEGLAGLGRAMITCSLLVELEHIQDQFASLSGPNSSLLLFLDPSLSGKRQVVRRVGARPRGVTFGCFLCWRTDAALGVLHAASVASLKCLLSALLGLTSPKRLLMAWPKPGFHLAFGSS